MRKGSKRTVGNYRLGFNGCRRLDSGGVTQIRGHITVLKTVGRDLIRHDLHSHSRQVGAARSQPKRVDCFKIVLGEEDVVKKIFVVHWLVCKEGHDSRSPLEPVACSGQRSVRDDVRGEQGTGPILPGAITDDVRSARPQYYAGQT